MKSVRKSKTKKNLNKEDLGRQDKKDTVSSNKYDIRTPYRQ